MEKFMNNHLLFSKHLVFTFFPVYSVRNLFKMKIKQKSNKVKIPPLKKAIKVKRKSSDLEEESTVSKAIRNVKKVFEKKNAEAPKLISNVKVVKKRKVFARKQKKTVRQKRQPRGVVYLGHIPHGFYEEQMAEYFKQFGVVTRVRVARSKNTGRSRGYGYVEFMLPEVAKIAAETMNNYLMCGRLLKATYIPPEKQHLRYFVGKPWTDEVYPKATNRDTVTRLRNINTDDSKHASFVQSTKDKLSGLEKKLKKEGFDIKFTPVGD